MVCRRNDWPQIRGVEGDDRVRIEKGHVGIARPGIDIAASRAKFGYEEMGSDHLCTTGGRRITPNTRESPVVSDSRAPIAGSFVLRLIVRKRARQRAPSIP